MSLAEGLVISGGAIAAPDRLSRRHCGSKGPHETDLIVYATQFGFGEGLSNVASAPLWK